MDFSYLSSRKHIYSAYLNMAMHNCFMNLMYIAKQMDCNSTNNYDKYIDKNNKAIELDTENISHSVLLEPNHLPQSNIDQEKLLNLFIEYFPMIIPSFESKMAFQQKKNPQCFQKSAITISDATWILKNIFYNLTLYRDATSHSIFNDTRQVNRECVHYWDFIYTVACRKVKENRKISKTDTAMSFMQNGRVNAKTKKINLYFRFCVTKDVNFTEFSEFGLMFFICSFLERKYAEKFLEELYKDVIAPKNLSKDQEDILFDVLTNCHIKSVKPKIDSTKDKLAHALDMLNELKKYPEELIDVLPKEKQKEVQKLLSSDRQTSYLRYSDRFPYLALRWIDQNKKFETLRFHVNFGKHHYVFHKDKCCADGEVRMRTIVDEMNGFGRIDDVENMRKGLEGEQNMKWPNANLVRHFEDIAADDPNMDPYISDTRTHYLINNNLIGISDSDYMSEVVVSDGKRKVTNKMPMCFLSVYDISGLVFHLILSREANKKGYIQFNTERVIKSYCNNYKKLFDDLENGQLPRVSCDFSSKYNLSWNEIPDKIKDIVTGKGKKDFFDYARKVFENEIALTEKRIERLEKFYGDENKMGKKGYVSIKPGKLADYLAADFVRFQPFDKPQDKPTGLNYRVLQASLATFSEASQLDNIKFILKNLKLTDPNSSCRHPFLGKVFDNVSISNVVELYDKYLQEKINYLNECLNKSRNKQNSILRNTPFLHSNKIKWSDMGEKDRNLLAAHYRSMPIMLPNGLFEHEIRDMLKLMFPKISDALDKKDDNGNLKCNTAYMIGVYNQKVCDDDFQPFYYDKMKKEDFVAKNVCTSKFKYSKEEAEIEEQRKHNEAKKYKKIDLVLHRMKIQDVMLFLMAKDSLSELDKFPVNDFKLKDICPSDESSILSAVIQELPLEFSLKGQNNIYKIKIVCENVKVKDYGKLISLFYDNRIHDYDYRHNNYENSILIQIADSPDSNGCYIYNYKDIRDELNHYDEERTGLFKLILDFENQIIDKLQESGNGNVNLHTRTDFNDILNYYGSKRTQASYHVSAIRNAMCHNVYPRLKSCSITDVNMPKIIDEVKKKFKESSDNFVNKV